jgi:hypothetical protein
VLIFLQKCLPNWRDRVRASALHLGLSLFVLGLVAWLTLRWCYPSPYSQATGGYKLLTLLASVDAILGPALTFCVFNRAKKSLRFDLVVIAALQLSALGYGVWAAVQGRPAFQVFMVDRFEILTANEIEPKEQMASALPFRQAGFGQPALAYWTPPQSVQERSELTTIGLSGTVQMRQLMHRFVPYDEKIAVAVLSKAKPIDELYRWNSRELVQAAIASSGRTAGELVFVPLDGRSGHLTVFLDRKTAQPVATIALDPWGQ